MAPGPRTPKNSRLPLASPVRSGEIDAEATTLGLTPPMKASIGPSAYATNLQPDVDAIEKSKRNFSELSTVSSQEIQRSKASRLDTLDPASVGSMSFDWVNQLIDAKLGVLETVIQGTDRHLKWLKQQWEAGDLSVTGKEYRENANNLEKMHRETQQSAVLLRSQKFKIIGEYIDRRVLQADNILDSVSDWAYIDLLLQRQRAPAKASMSFHEHRDEKSQERFRSRLLKAYNAKRSRTNPYDESVQLPDQVWCCIDGEWNKSSDVTAAHLVPYNTGETNASYIFGKTDEANGHLMSVKNGLPISKYYETFLDDAEMVLVPVPNTNKIKVVVFDVENAVDRLKRIDGRELVFQNDMRPAKRYLYFNYAVNLLRRQRYEVPGYWTDFNKVGLKDLWASPGEYLRKSTLLTLAHRVGHLSHEEAKAFTSNAPGLTKGSEEGSELEPEKGGLWSKRDLEVVDAVSVSRRDEETDPFLQPAKKRTALLNKFAALLTSDNEEGNDEDEDEDDDDDEE